VNAWGQRGGNPGDSWVLLTLDCVAVNVGSERRGDSGIRLTILKGERMTVNLSADQGIAEEETMRRSSERNPKGGLTTWYQKSPLLRENYVTPSIQEDYHPGHFRGKPRP